LSVYAEGGDYVIIDGYLRFLACKELRIESFPCNVYPAPAHILRWKEVEQSGYVLASDAHNASSHDAGI
jgi:ParB-like chromosome segregation protein Spo0J